MCERVCFKEMEVNEHVTLLPSYLGKIGEGVTELLTSRVLLYHSTYNGVLLSFTHVRVLQSTGLIVDELPHIHINIAYTATVFTPQVGDVMCGCVNRVGVDHIGCLLYNCFNVSITCAPANDSSETSVLRSWCTRSFGAGEEVWFSVSGVVVTGGILSLRGQYRDEGKGGGGGGGGRGREEGEGGGGGKGGGEDGTGVSGSDNGRKKLKVKKQKETHRKRKRESEG